MYPLHKFVPLPFGTYMMYIDHDKQRVDVEAIPENISHFKQKFARKSLRKPIESESRSTGQEIKHGNAKKQSESLDTGFAEPSYRMRYLLHDGQVTTEQPPYVTLVDKVTGASINSSSQWIKNRPKPWNDVIKIHQILNPEMTCTVKKAEKSADFQVKLPAITDKEEQSMSSKIGQAPTRLQPFKDHQLLRREMRSHLHKSIKYSREKELMAGRDVAARKRRKKVDKIMQIVSEKALSSKISPTVNSNNSNTTSIKQRIYQETKAKANTAEPNETLENDWRKSHKAMKAFEPVPFQAKDWNPRADQSEMNHVILERIGNTVPYQWKEKNPILNPREPAYYQVL